MNAINVIHPYKYEGMWVFDDDKVGLVQEPFVAGTDAIIDDMVWTIPAAEKGFALVFSANPFPGYQVEFRWRREEMGGNWYFSTKHEAEGWLCPALFKYFDGAPEKIFAEFRMRTRSGRVA